MYLFAMGEGQDGATEDVDVKDDEGESGITEHVDVEGDATKTTSEDGETLCTSSYPSPAQF